MIIKIGMIAPASQDCCRFNEGIARVSILDQSNHLTCVFAGLQVTEPELSLLT